MRLSFTHLRVAANTTGLRLAAEIDSPAWPFHTGSMRRAALIFACLGSIGSAQVDLPITTAPLSPERTAVYRAALSDFGGGSPYYLIDLTGVLRPDEGDFAGCMKDFHFLPHSQVLHRLSSQFAKSIPVRLISPEMAAKHPFPPGFSGVGVTSMTSTPPSLPPEDPVAKNARVVLSEIIFDSRHRRAALNVSISGPGAGHSETHVFRLTHGRWILEADCGSGIS